MNFKDKLNKPSFKFSFILLVNDLACLNDSIESIFNQSIGFENIEIILVDELNNANSFNVCSEYQYKHPNNIFYISQKECPVSVYNYAINISTGKYLKFIVSGDKLDLDACEIVYQFFEENKYLIDVIIIPIESNSDFKNRTSYQNINFELCDLIKNPKYVSASLFSYFFKQNTIKNMNFNSKLLLNDDLFFLNDVLVKNPIIGIFHNYFHYYLCKNNYSNLFNSDQILNKFKVYSNEFLPYFKLKYKFDYIFCKYYILYKIQSIFYKKHIEKIFSEVELEELKRYSWKLLQEIDDEYILNSDCDDKNLKYTLLIFKHGYLTTKMDNFDVKKLVNGNVIDALDFHLLYIDSIEIYNNTLSILGFMRSYFHFHEIQIQAIKFNKQDFLINWETYFNKNKLLFFKKEFLNIKGIYFQNNAINSLKYKLGLENNDLNLSCYDYLKKDKFNNFSRNIKDFDEWFTIEDIRDVRRCEFINNDIYNEIYELFSEQFIENYGSIFEGINVEYNCRERKYLDLNYISFFNYEISLPLSDFENSIVKLRIIYKSLKFYLNITFQNYAKLSDQSFYSFKNNKYIIKFKNNSFEIFNYSLNKLITLEKENIDYLMSKEDLRLLEVIKFREEYLYSFFKYFGKTIWLFMDRLDSADDNAEHLYKYAINQNDGVEKYFVISKYSKDFHRLKKWANVVIAGSKEHKLLFCHADKIISSHVDDEFLNPFHGDYELGYSGLFSSKIYFLQHGVTLHDVSSWLHKYDKYVYLISTLSKFEYESFFSLNSEYNYDDSVVQLLGFPRFDNLKKLKDKKEIIIMPTWRRNLNNFTDDNFRESQFFEVYNSLLNNEKLISFLNNKNYKLIFKPHPNLLKYIHLFNQDLSVEFDIGRSYNDIFNHSSLIITDFSSVAFDFAYLKKPVIYYHFEDDYHFNISNSYFDYFSMGFGEIISNEKDLVNLIIEYVNLDCNMKSKYVDRVDEFFEFNDMNNCKRVYDFIINDGCDLMKKTNLIENKIDNLSIICKENESIKSENIELRKLLNELSNIHQEYSDLVIKQKNDIIVLKNSVNELSLENSKLHKQIDEIHFSKSWKLTKPLRKFKKFIANYL